MGKEQKNENIADQFDGLSKEELIRTRALVEERIRQDEFLPLNEEYSETMASPMEEVENNPKKFIIEECIPACKELWEKNIYTYMVSDYVNENQCWIEIDVNNLSEENLNVYRELGGDDVIKFSYHAGFLNFGVKGVGKKAQQRLLELASKFQMQDVPYGYAYITLEEFLIEKGCYKVIKNPNYVKMEKPNYLKADSYEDIEYQDEYEEWLASDKSEEFLKVFDKSKMTKSLEEYLKESNAIYEDNRIYLSEYHYNKHKNYVNYINTINSEKEEIKKI